MASTRPPPEPRQALRSLATVRDAIRFAVSRMEAARVHFGHGTDNAFDEAVWLVLWALRLPLDRLEPFLDARLLPSEIGSVVTLIERRCAERIPAAWLTGEAWLRGRRFLCDPRALVPRSPIAEAMEEALDSWLVEPPATVLDLCTGGASLAIIAAQHWSECRVDAVDLSEEALALARENVALHGLEERIQLHRGDLCEPLPPAQRFDLILCNPPYVNQQSMDRLPAEFAAESTLALAGGEDGMDVIRRILPQACERLAPHGALLLEIGHEAPHFEAAFPQLEFTWIPVTLGEQWLVWLSRDQWLAWRDDPGTR